MRGDLIILNFNSVLSSLVPKKFITLFFFFTTNKALRNIYIYVLEKVSKYHINQIF